MRRASFVTIALVVLAASACPRPVTRLAEAGCPPADRAAPSTFPPCDLGSGAFGRWTVDVDGLPAYRYTLDNAADDRALWTLSDGSTRRDHLFQIGNDRVIGVVDTDGFVQLFSKDRGPTFLNRVDRLQDRTGGGYSWLRVGGGDAFASAFGLRRDGTEVERVFGVQAASHRAKDGALTVTHRVTAPAGDLPLVVDEVTIENGGPAAELVHFEVWDVNRHALNLQLLRSGSLSPSVPIDGDAARDALNADFTLSAVPDGADGMRLRHTSTKATPSDPAGPAPLDDHPQDIFLAALDDVARQGAFITQRALFFGAGGAVHPDAVFSGDDVTALLPEGSAAGEPGTLVHRVDLSLAEGEQVTLRYAFGAVDAGAPLPLGTLPDDVRGATAAAALAAMPLVAVDDAPRLHRESAWHAAQLLGATAYDASFGVHHTVQGSAYQYLHGLDGAARDYALFAVPLAYLRPDLARENLRMLARMTFAESGQISYATTGFGMTEDAAVHTAPSDLDLFFLWALAEYVVATGDRAFLDDQNPYWPPDAALPGTMREHAVRAARHLIDDVGTGPHGLIRVGTGDWSDGIVFLADDRATATAVGESVPNSQMATWVLPVAAGALFAGDPLAAELTSYAGTLRAELVEEWTGAWFRRAWFDVDEPFGDDHLDLESQVWALIGGTFADDAQRDLLIESVYTRLDEPSAVGAPLVEGGQVWHAITALLTWGYNRSRPDLAYRSLQNHTMAAAARAQPAQWFGIWSGPDGFIPSGGTWASPATPMTDWPVMNTNQHALPLLALVRSLGLEPGDDGALHLLPSALPAPFAVELPGLTVRKDEVGTLSGELRLLVDGAVRLVVEPAGAAPFDVVASGAAGTAVSF
ncbi:MAG: hypothetical protein HYS27_10230 [Deltaproteobacteria bacterium]|nr:hypothetical protein [Deltaproteobacteria bacterium]